MRGRSGRSLERPRRRTTPSCSCSSPTLLFDETRFAEALEAFRKAAEAPTTPGWRCARASASSRPRCGSAQFQEAQREAASLKTAGAAQSRGARRRTPTRVWSAGLFDEAEHDVARRAGDRAGVVARASRPGPGAGVALASSTTRSNEAQAALQAVAARRRAAPHRRLDLRADAPLRAGRRRLHQLHQPAAQQGSQRQGARGRGRRSASSSRSASASRIAHRRGRRGPPAHRRLPARRRQGDRQGQGERRPAAGLRARHRLRADDHLAADGVDRPACGRSPTRSAPASARSACAACSSDGSTRSRSAR